MEIRTFRSLRKERREKLGPLSVERGVRQLLADKITGNLVGLWLLAPEHLRLGTWDLLTQWAGPSPSEISSRLALQLVHEAALLAIRYRPLTRIQRSPTNFAAYPGYRRRVVEFLEESFMDVPPLQSMVTLVG